MRPPAPRSFDAAALQAAYPRSKQANAQLQKEKAYLTSQHKFIEQQRLYQQLHAQYTVADVKRIECYSGNAIPLAHVATASMLMRDTTVSTDALEARLAGRA